MFSGLGPIEIGCDAPPYPVVKACKEVGFESPLDVRWCRLSHFLRGCGKGDGAPGLATLRCHIGKSQLKKQTCTCATPLPPLGRYRVMFLSGKVADYYMGQCRRCQTIFWEEG
jgi:hypothetical protein